ncbi:MAG: lamin tail domain-containing protein [Anaerolineae bacterium]|nr:lamin tail domain-containing protein [Anaerolineae bacterium]
MRRSIWLLIVGMWLLAPTAAAQKDVTLLITEVYYNTPGDDEVEEWIELANFSDAPIALENYKLGDEETTGGQEGMQRFPRESTIGPDEVIVVARTAGGFEAFFGRKPTFEMFDSDPLVPNMRNFPLLADGETVLNNSGDEIILLDPTNAIVDALSYGDSTTFMLPPIASAGRGESIERVPADCDTDDAADWQPQRTPTPFDLSFDGECAGVDSAETRLATSDYPPIGTLQGSGSVAASVNEIVTFDGIVTGIHADRNADGVVFYTLFVQDMPGTEDGDPTTSDAMPIFLGVDAPEAAVGDHVLVSGQVTEFFGLTEIDNDNVAVRILSSNNPLPEPIIITPPAADDAALLEYYEPLEGMLVTFGDETARVVGATFEGCGLAVVRADSGVERIIRDSADDPIGVILPILHYDETDCASFPVVKAGDTMDGLTGPLTYHFDQFKIVLQADNAVHVTEGPLPPLPEMPSATANQISIVSFNVENFFDEIDDTGSSAEPKLTAEEQAAKRTKIAYAIGTLLHCPTFVAIQEVENETLLTDLVAELAETCDFVYEISHRESVDSRGIDVALLSNPQQAAVQAVNLRQGCTVIETGIEDESAECSADQHPLFSRPPLQVDLLVDGEPLTVFVNHFKSKRGGEVETEPRRIAQAQHINGLVRSLLERDPGAAIIVTGDFNDFGDAPAMQVMTEGDGVLTNVLWQVSEEQRYTFVFSGASQLIDGMLIAPGLLDRIADVAILHTNADFPDAWGSDLSAERIAYKSTDHDIPLLILQWETAAATAEPETTAVASPTPETVTDEIAEENSADNPLLPIAAGAILLGLFALGGFLFWRQRRAMQ